MPILHRGLDRPPGHLRRTLTLAAAAALALAVLVVPAAPAQAADTLGAAAAASGRAFGAAVSDRRLDEPAYTTVLDREFTSVTAENAMKWEETEPRRGTFSLDRADRIVAHARDRGMAIRGHALVWHRQLPDWVRRLSGDDLRTAMTSHITTLVERWRGQIGTWDVVNEAFVDGPSGAHRPSVFQRELGDGYVASAFHAAREADPDATLCYNDYRIGDLDDAKTQAVYDMVRDFLERGVPIDCVGVQSHFDRRSPVPDSFQETIEAFAALGVEVQLTELDIEGSGEQQAASYRRVVEACVAVPACTSITVWGVADRYSWRAPGTPLLFDDDHAAKSAYRAVLAVLDGATVEVPVASAVLDPEAPDGAVGWYRSPVTVSVGADDPRAEVEVDAGDGWRAADTPIRFEDDGEHALTYRAKNAAGASEVGEVTIARDAAAPVTVFAVDGDGSPGATVTLTATDATSGVAVTEWRLDDGDVTAYRAPVVVEDPGWHTLAFRSTDVAGNAETWQTFAVMAAGRASPDSGGRASRDSGGRATPVIVQTGCRGPYVVGGDGRAAVAARVDAVGQWTDRGTFVHHFDEMARDVAADGVIDARQRAAFLCHGRGPDTARPSSPHRGTEEPS